MKPFHRLKNLKILDLIMKVSENVYTVECFLFPPVNFFNVFFFIWFLKLGFPLFTPVSFSECAISRGLHMKTSPPTLCLHQVDDIKVIYHWKGYSTASLGVFSKKFQSMWKTRRSLI